LRKLVVLFFALGFGSVQAFPVTWTLEDVVFDDGGIAFGSFDYDTDTNAYSAINITTTAGSTLSGTQYGFINPDNPFITSDNPQFVDATGDLTGAQTLPLYLQEGLTNSGGVVAFKLGNSLSGVSLEDVCFNSGCSVGGTPRFMVSGYVTAVPIPAAAWLFGSALAGLGWVRRKRTV
jgi:hypothetical protein